MAVKLTRAAWNDILSDINALAVNPPSQCSGKTPLSLAGPNHIWRMSDITAARNKLLEICSDDAEWFVEDNQRWDADYLTELNRGISHGWCNCGPEILETWDWPIDIVSYNPHYTQPYFTYGSGSFTEVGDYPYKIDLVQLVQNYVNDRYEGVDNAWGTVKVYREHLDVGGSIQGGTRIDRYRTCEFPSPYTEPWDYIDWPSPAKFGVTGGSGSLCAGGSGHDSTYPYNPLCYQIGFTKWFGGDIGWDFWPAVNGLHKDYCPNIEIWEDDWFATSGWAATYIPPYQTQTQWRIEIVQE